MHSTSDARTREKSCTLIAFCGVDGAGKTSLIDGILQRDTFPHARYVKKRYHGALNLVREFHSTPFGDGRDWSRGPFSVSASSAAAFDFLVHYKENISPEICKPGVVISDRYRPCYQVYMECTGSSLSAEDLFSKIPDPDLYVYVTTDLDLLPSRYAGRGGATDDETPELMENVHVAYERYFAKCAIPTVRIHNVGPFDKVLDELCEVLSGRVVTNDVCKGEER